jgi:hypothetical protein
MSLYTVYLFLHYTRFFLDTPILSAPPISLDSPREASACHTYLPFRSCTQFRPELETSPIAARNCMAFCIHPLPPKSFPCIPVMSEPGNKTQTGIRRQQVNGWLQKLAFREQ